MRQKSHTKAIYTPKMVLSKRSKLGEGRIHMVRWKLKSCPRCGGDIFIDRNLDGWYEQCLQCSYQRELRGLAEFKERPTRKEKEPVKAGRHQI
jgi:ribosomal protein S27AE